MKKRILFIDDEINVLDSYRRWSRSYQNEWDISFFDCPAAAWDHIQRESCDAIVTDLHMPRMNGLNLLSRIKQYSATSDIPVILVTGCENERLKRLALDQEAADVLKKPVDLHDLRARICNSLRQKQAYDSIKFENDVLELLVQARTAELAASRLDIVWRLGKAAEFRDEETGEHVIRVGCYSRAIAITLKMEKKFVETLFLAAPLHDLGKIGIPDSILLKPGKLNAEERLRMQQHCEFGAAILANNSKFFDFAREYGGSSIPDLAASSSNPLLEMASDIARYHHEKWDGSGYPSGLSGDQIPISARITAVADVYDALRSARPYKQPFSLEKSLEIMKSESGRHFDPAVIKAFFSSLDTILSIEEKFSRRTQQADCTNDDLSLAPTLGTLALSAGEIHA